ncbi:unnamed protein product [Ectocarpus fasciculatus]
MYCNRFDTCSARRILKSARRLANSSTGSRTATRGGVGPSSRPASCLPANPDIHWNAASVSNVTEEDEPKEIKGWIPLLLGLLEINDKTQVIIRTLKILGIILQVVRDPDAWRRLRHLLSSSDTEVRSWACRVIRCVTNGNKEQSRAVIDAGIVPVLIQRLADVNFDIQWNAAPAISHVTEVGEPDEVRGWISLLLSLLENDDIQGDFVVSKTLEKILKVRLMN